jgi:hypothetical protein
MALQTPGLHELCFKALYLAGQVESLISLALQSLPPAALICQVG